MVVAEVQDLGWGRLGACGLLLVVVIVLSYVMELELTRRLVVAASRCAAQLLLLCGFILEPMFTENRPAYIFPYLMVILVLASREAAGRVTYEYDGLGRHFATSFAVVCGSVILFAVLVLNLKPWFDAHYLVPIAGMLLGNNLTATAIAADALLSDLVEGADRVELRLCRAATWFEAVLPSVRKALKAALTPTLNSMAVMGLVMIPGMMTGQLLGGQPPLEAGMYQVMIMYLVTVSGCFASSAVVCFTVFTVFDTGEHALLRDRVRRVSRGPRKKDVLVDAVLAVAGLATACVACVRRRASSYARAGQRTPTERMALAAADVENDNVALVPKTSANAAAAAKSKRFYAVTDDPTGAKRRETGEVVVFQAEDVVVARTRLHVTFALTAGSKTSLSGASGSGKTTTLKVLARISARASGELRLAGEPTARIDAPTWRARVVYVPQDRPTLTGTPRDLYVATRAYRTQRRRARSVDYDDDDGDAPVRQAAKWGLDTSKFDQAWATLSGGEAQRASLAIALALKPEVLLLDEPTSALDAATTALVEKDLLDSRAAVLIVTHSVEQAARLCRYHIRIHAQRHSDRNAVFTH
ncbi:hypothetical protein CTAYLR_003377 [Chrysophaeum taylorii]|uniref:ABC transporter domain-containing protein n=1 Tax=Chrysophaeum taylorii TaxID=2483200 RepID=A0AAD7UFF2_9STRA|nr:hypothetical protein CTAYLR_003377 [Chrysophaeum taylorii]